MAIRFDGNGLVYTTSRTPLNTSWSGLVWCQQSVDTNLAAVLISLSSSTNNCDIEFSDADGTTLGMYVAGSGFTAFSSSPTLGEPFCVAVTVNGTTQNGYWRRPGGEWITQTATRGSYTPSGVYLGDFHTSDPNYGFNGMLWGAKSWTRPLTAGELYEESLSYEVVHSRNLHFWLPMAYPGDCFDRGPFKLSTTKAGTLATEYPRVLVPGHMSRSLRGSIPVPYVASGGGGTFQILAGRRFSLAGVHGLAGD